MPAKAQWDDEESDSSSAPPSPPVAPVGAARRKFDDEEDEDDDVLDSWDAAEDSEVEREKAKKASEAKAKAEAEALANKKSKAQRIKEHQESRAARALEGDDSDDEDEAEKRERLRRTEKESDLKHAEDLFGDAGGVPSGRKAQTVGTAVAIDSSDPTRTVNIADMALFNPTTKTQFEHLRNTLIPIIGSNAKKAHYGLFLQEFAKQLAKDLPSDQIKKVASTLTALGNEKMKEEKTASGSGKKTKAAKTKTSVVTSRVDTVDTQTYDDAFGDDDFM